MRHLHTSRSAGAWFMAPVARATVAVGARLGRGLWKRMGEERRQAVKDALRKRTGFIVGGVSVASAGAVGYYYSHVEETPVTKRSRFMMINRQKMVEMIDQEKESLISLLTLGHAVLPASDPAYSQILPILNRILPVLRNHWSGGEDINDIQWILYVLDSPDIANAVCLPTGEIFVHSGLLKVCQNQDQLAFILAHEVAHVLMNHGGETFSNKGLMDFLFLFVVASLWLVIPSDLIAFFMHKWSHSLAAVLFELPYSRQLEEEADTVGLMLLSSACFTPSKSIEVWNHFPSDKMPEYLSSHPVNENRLESLRNLLPIASQVWEASSCQAMEIEMINFRNIANKTLKGIFS